MADLLVERFIAALHALEERRELEPIAATFAAEAEVSNVVAPRTFRGQDGAREFWSRYRGAFGEVRSSFRNAIVADRRAALEWTTEGTDAEGAPIRYDGVSILEFDGEAITRFRAYFDSVNLGRQMADEGKAPATTGAAGGGG